MPQCAAKTKHGKKPCQAQAIHGGSVCRMHGGGAPQVKAKAAERIKALEAPALLAIEQLIDPKVPERAIRLAAAKFALEMNGHNKQNVAVNVSGDPALIEALLAGRKRVGD